MKKVFEFSKPDAVNAWRVVNDGVMGGVSSSSLVCTEAGHGLFSGNVSLENNGGFASIQLNTTIQLEQDNKYILLRIKGDGKSFQFRLKHSIQRPEAYVQSFATSGEWEVVRLPIAAFAPQFRGRSLDMPNFNFTSITQCSFLIANKKQEHFNLLIDWIAVA